MPVVIGNVTELVITTFSQQQQPTPSRPQPSLLLRWPTPIPGIMGVETLGGEQMALSLTGRVVGQDKGGADKLRASYRREGVRLPAGGELVAQPGRDWDGGNGRAQERLEPGEDQQVGKGQGEPQAGPNWEEGRRELRRNPDSLYQWLGCELRAVGAHAAA